MAERTTWTDGQKVAAVAAVLGGLWLVGKYAEAKREEDKKKDQVILPIYLPGSLDPRFSTCGEARARGYGPYYINVDAEYWWYVDADADGIVCEPYYP